MTLDPCPSAAELLRMKAEREARSRRQTFYREPSLAPQAEVTTVAAGTMNVAILSRPLTILMPVRLRIPWSALASDNDKYRVNKEEGRLYATAQYREAKKRIKNLATEAMDGRPAAACPLALVARVYVPDNRVHDVVNFSKCCHDAMKGVVFTDDQWLHDVRWIRAGVDVDAPRCELTITPLTPR
jgi:Holliday junction resolvase RusA-like endonuclease